LTAEFYQKKIDSIGAVSRWEPLPHDNLNLHQDLTTFKYINILSNNCKIEISCKIKKSELFRCKVWKSDYSTQRCSRKLRKPGISVSYSLNKLKVNLSVPKIYCKLSTVINLLKFKTACKKNKNLGNPVSRIEGATVYSTVEAGRDGMYVAYRIVKGKENNTEYGEPRVLREREGVYSILAKVRTKPNIVSDSDNASVLTSFIFNQFVEQVCINFREQNCQLSNMSVGKSTGASRTVTVSLVVLHNRRNGGR